MLMPSSHLPPNPPSRSPTRLTRARWGVRAGTRMVWSDEFNGRTARPSQMALRNRLQQEGMVQQGAAILFRRLARQPAAWSRPPDHRSAARDAIRARDWGGQHYTSGRIVSKGRRLDLWLLRSARQAALRARHLAGDLDAPGRHEEMARRRRDRHHGAGRHRAEPHLRLAPHRLVQPCAEDAAQRAAAGPDQLQAFHRYQLDWRPDQIASASTTAGFFAFATTSRAGRGAWPFFTPFNLILNLAMGGDWAGAKGMDDAALPQRMEVDYVRVWQGR